MNKLINHQRNVIPFDQFKVQRMKTKEEKGLRDYLGLLSFNQLINETSSVINELNNTPLNAELTLHSKLVLKEFAKRLGTESTTFSTTLKKLGNRLEERIFELQGLL
ncbi:MAG: hypothetical protein HN509_17965 [Halobacteriovoraceae bacterium]|jgi:hypothetical protein|nr:hypothetical protein [Halobacteriovoraceae bacterium]MBT5094961.1 hypothetical protein [Halobacteriovoraceae bacterium]